MYSLLNVGDGPEPDALALRLEDLDGRVLAVLEPLVPAEFPQGAALPALYHQQPGGGRTKG